jgi:hypothetical protein
MLTPVNMPRQRRDIPSRYVESALIRRHLFSKITRGERNAILPWFDGLVAWVRN